MTGTDERTVTLHGISQIRGFLRPNPQPVYFVSPTAFNLLGIDRWVRSFFYVNWMDSFDGNHPRVFVPHDRVGCEFETMEECARARRPPRDASVVRAPRPAAEGVLRHVR